MLPMTRPSKNNNMTNSQSSSTATDPGATIEPCTSCSSNFGVNDCCIGCYTCQNWFHINCVNITKTQFNVIRVMSNVQWFCDSCSVPQRVDKNDRDYPEFTKMNDRISAIEAAIKICQMR